MSFDEIFAQIDNVYENDIDFLLEISQKNNSYMYSGMLDTLKIYDRSKPYLHAVMYDSINTKEEPCEKCALPYSGWSDQCSFCWLIELHYIRFARIHIDIENGSYRKKAWPGDKYCYWWVDKSEVDGWFVKDYKAISREDDPEKILEIVRQERTFNLEAMSQQELFDFVSGDFELEERMKALKKINEKQNIVELHVSQVHDNIHSKVIERRKELIPDQVEFVNLLIPINQRGQHPNYKNKLMNELTDPKAIAAYFRAQRYKDIKMLKKITSQEILVDFATDPDILRGMDFKKQNEFYNHINEFVKNKDHRKKLRKTGIVTILLEDKVTEDTIPIIRDVVNSIQPDERLNLLATLPEEDIEKELVNLMDQGFPGEEYQGYMSKGYLTISTKGPRDMVHRTSTHAKNLLNTITNNDVKEMIIENIIHPYKRTAEMKKD